MKPEKIREYYSDYFDSAQIALLLNWGCIIGIVFFPVQVWLCSKPEGFHKSMSLGICLCFLSRIIVISASISSSSITALFLAHLGQILNAASGPLCMGTVTRLAIIWFPGRQMSLAVSLAIASNGFGTNIAFLLGPIIASNSNGIETLLIVGLFLSAMPVLLLCLLPRRPLNVAGEHQFEERFEFWDGFKKAISNRNYGLVLFATGVLCGVTTGWQGVMQSSLNGIYSDTDIGLLAFSFGMSGNIGAISSGFLDNENHIVRNIWIAGCVLLVCVVSFSVLISSHVSLAVMISLMSLSGLVYGGLQPMLYTLSSGLVFPVHEGTSVGILVFGINFWGQILIMVSATVPPQWMNPIYIVSIVLVYIMLVPVKK